jgi:hypothetical protein
MLQGLRPRKGFLTGRDRAPARSAGFKARYHESVSGGLRSVVAATAEELRFTDCLGGALLATPSADRPKGR